ncbi:MAG TPA: hypothetical protein VFJ90_16845, partial [Candidatus Didemnitutus sp.]|nr:hypothetical protein [Candidatus Didemnitutus sp.]
SLSLAALRFRHVMATDGGPIARLELADTTVLGARQFQSNAHLRSDLIAWRTTGQVFSSASGSGTASSPMVARFKAVSEAIERWAQMAVVTSDRRHQFGFDVDPSSNGMAAFPGLFRRQARPAALWEAVERFNVLSWWEGRLPATEQPTRWPGVRAAVICSEAPGVTVILFRTAREGHVAYGHAAGPDFDSACQRAAVELERHDYVVRSYALIHAGALGDNVPEQAHAIERRSVFFASPEGHELFLERLRSRPHRVQSVPKLVFDGPIPGEWDRYASVWRVVYAPPSERFLSNDGRYFFW